MGLFFIPRRRAVCASDFCFLFKTDYIYSRVSGTCAQIYSICFFYCSNIRFYKCCTQYFKKNYTRLAAVFIFAICQPLIAFSTIFKQYSTDVLIACICLYYFPRIKEFDRKELIITGVSICILPFISLPSLFFIGAFLLKNLKNTFKLLLPFAVMMLLYYFFNLAPAKLDLDTHFPNYWNDGFLAFL